MSVRAVLSDYRVALERPAENARERWEERRGVLLTLEHGRHFGQGEAAPLPGYSGESLAAVRAELARFDGAAVPDPAELGLAELDASVRAGGLVSRAARGAAETALLDLGARRRGLSLHAWLRELCSAAGVPVNDLGERSLAALVDALALEPALARADAALDAGFTALKLKIGRPGRFDEERRLLEALRTRHGSAPLRTDANGAFDAEAASAALAALAGLGLEFVEEPLVPALPLLREPPLPVALDESLVRGFSLDRAAARAAGVVALVLKPGLLGLLASVELAERARHAGLAVVVSHAFEGPVGYAAAVELALALGAQPFAAGLAPHAALAAWPTTPRPAGLAGARLVPHTEAGLGLPRVGAPP